MILLDTDHFSVLRYPEYRGHQTLRGRMLANPQETFAITVVTAEEQMRGWLAYIKKARNFIDQVQPYDKLLQMLDALKNWQIVRFDQRAAEESNRLLKARVRIGTQDLKIAAMTLVNQGLLLSANRKDFGKVPGLRVENWLA